MQAGGRVRLRRAATRPIGTSDPRFPSLFDVGREHSRAATHVDAREGVLSDAGSTPAASTTFKLLKQNGLDIFSPFKVGTNQVQLCVSDLANH
jgi:hypothetical protein